MLRQVKSCIPLCFLDIGCSTEVSEAGEGTAMAGKLAERKCELFFIFELGRKSDTGCPGKDCRVLIATWRKETQFSSLFPSEGLWE